MISKRYGEIPTHFNWAMWLDVQGLWCALMLPIILWAWSLSLGEFCSLLVMASVLVLIAIYDILYGLIYDQLILSLLLLSVMPLFLGHLEPADACMGALLGSGLLGGLRYLSHGGLGLGDVKLAVPLGAWLGWEDLLLCLLLAAVMGLIYGGWLYLRHRLHRQTPLPFGPFLAWGALAAFGWGNPIRACVEAGLCW